MRMRHIVIRHQLGSTVFFSHYFIEGKIFEHKLCVSILPTTSVWNIHHCKNKEARYDQTVHMSVCRSTAQYRWSCQVLMKL
jgi:hypothetical protein